MRKCYDAKRSKWLDSFTRQFTKRIFQSKSSVSFRDLEPFGLVGTLILQEVLSPNWAIGAFGGKMIGPGTLADNLQLSSWTVRRILKALARAGFIKGISSRDGAAKKQRPLEIMVNPALESAVINMATQKQLTQLAGVFADMWLSRRDYDGAVQGFETVVKWGLLLEKDSDGIDFAEGATTGRISLAQEGETPKQSLVGRVRTWADEFEKAREGKRLDAKAAREELRKQDVLRKDKFVEGAAIMWKTSQSKFGFGDAPPAWAAPKHLLPVQMRRERIELEKIFSLYGTMRTAVAWNVFISGRVEKDSQGKIKFDPSRAFAQWTTDDKRPSQFAKYINQVLPLINYHLKDEAHTKRLRNVFGDLLDWTPGENILNVPLYDYSREAQTTNGDQATATA